MPGTSSVTGDQSIFSIDNITFDQTNRGPSSTGAMATDGQLWIGATTSNLPNNGGHVRVGRLNSPLGTINIGYLAPNITLDVVGGAPVISISGGPGVTITGTAANPIVNSVIFTDTTATTLAVDNGYNATAAGTYNMPATAAQGEMIIVFCDTAGAVVLDCPALNFIRIGNQITSASGTATSTAIGDSLTLRYRLSSLTWEATSVIGNWTIA